MIAFWFIAVVFIAIALAFLLPPLLKKRPQDSKLVDRKDLTVNVYKDQFEELENDLKNEVISQEQYDSAKADIERNFLEDMKRLEEGDETAEAVTPTSAKMSAMALIAVVPVLAIILYGTWGAGARGLDPDSAEPEVNTAEHQQQTINNMIAQLEQRLEQEPNDPEGWFMLARSYKFQKRFKEAADVFEKLMQMGGDKVPDALAAYADTVAMASGRQITPKAISLLEKAIELDPNHVQGLWLIGTAAYQQGDFKSALGFWERLIKVLPPGSNEAQQIAANIDEVRSRLGMAPSAPPSMMTPPMMQQGGVASGNSVAAAGGGIKEVNGTVMLGGAIASKASADDTVFIFARAADGPRMPLAIVRKQVKDLPFKFKLDDSLAMNPSMKLSGFGRVIVGARISKTGNAMSQPGDLEGFSDEIRVNSSSGISVIINSEVR
ncbi:MAG: c-type cytochrome biogenesis protein CcmI [Gammaproteobacteria bacterium]|nr:c-type cytochrome biogenesis protein CcmI [Gammaproteobacteria bacterium]